MIEIPAAEIAKGTTRAEVRILVPEAWQDEWLDLAARIKKRGAHQMYIKLGLPRKPRSTGYRSQNTHVHGHASQIAESVGESKSKIIADAVSLASGQLGEDFPTYVDYKGDRVLCSEPEWDSRTAAVVIDKLHDIAGVCGVTLKEHHETED